MLDMRNAALLALDLRAAGAQALLPAVQQTARAVAQEIAVAIKF